MDVQEILNDVNVDIPTFIDDKKETIEKAANYSDEYSSIPNETCLLSLNTQPNFDNDCINIARGKGKHQCYEELAFPLFFLLVSLVIELKEM